MRHAALLLAFALTVADPGPVGAQSASTVSSEAALRAAAERGDAVAQLDYAKALGPGHPDSRAWARKAAEQGHGEAWFWLGYHAPGDEARPFYEKAADAGVAQAFPFVFDHLLLRAGRRADVVAAKRYADLARARGLASEADAAVYVTVDRCAEAGVPRIPAADQPSPSARAGFAGKPCAAFLEGVGGDIDFGAYRGCLLSEDPVEHNWLAEVYANGWGVVRAPMLAIALLCHGSDVPAELIDVVEVLYATRGQERLDEEFRFCEHVTSGYNSGRCAARDEALDVMRRTAALRTLSAGWPPAHLEAFARLQAAAERFFAARASAEIDMSGTMRAALALDEARTLRDAFVEVLREAAAGKLPPRSDLKAADAALNRAYRAAVSADLDLGTVTHARIRDTQRAWLPYRDAWGEFGALHFPQRTAAEWKAWATRVRTAQLRALLGVE